MGRLTLSAFALVVLLVGPVAGQDEGCMLDAATPSGTAASDGFFDWPLARLDPTGELAFGHDVRVQQNYGNTDNSTAPGTPHTGMDLQWYPRAGESYGTNTIDAPVHAASGGEVFCVGHDWGAQGWVVVLRHAAPDDDHVFTLYGHLNEPALSCGDRLERGQVVGTIQAWPGDPPNTHVHYEIRRFGEWTHDDRRCAGPGYRAEPAQEGWLDPVAHYYSYPHRPGFARPVVTSSAVQRNLRLGASEDSEQVRDWRGHPVVLPPSTRVTGYAVMHDLDAELHRWWYLVRYQGRSGWINGFLWQSEKASQLAVGEPSRLGPDWPSPPLASAIWYRFDDPRAFGTGVVPNAGSGGRVLDGLVRGDARLAAGSALGPPFGYSLLLDGETGFVEVGSSELLDWFRRGLAIEAHIRRVANEGEDAIVGKWFGEDQWLLTVYPDGNGLLIFSVRLADGTYASVEHPIPDDGYLGRWVRVGARAEPTGWLRLYWEGKLVAQKRLPASLLHLAPSDSPIHVGDAGVGTSWSRFRGQIDELRIWYLPPWSGGR